MNKNLLKKIYFGALLLIGSITYAQTVSGTVSDASGPLPGVNVIVKGTSNGAATDFDGNYSLSNVPSDAILVFSSMGYLPQEIPVNGQSTINALLVEDAAQLDEVVIIGYGSSTKKEVTSAVTTVSEEEFNQGTINDAATLLQGKVAGLSIYKKGGNPTSTPTIRLRGISTVGANASPLIIIDGVQGGSLENLNPSDIETFNVLKDGSAAAIYGTRGSSGVILITTKKGRAGQTVAEYNGSIATSSIANTIKQFSAQEYVAAGYVDLGEDTDWLDEVTETAITQIHNMSISGGFEDTRYRVSANFREVNGIVKNTGYDQFNTRANFSTRILDDKLKIEFNTSYNKRNAELGHGDVLEFALTTNPTMPIYAADAPYTFSETQYGGYFEALGLFRSANPVSIQDQYLNYGTKTIFNYNVDLTYDITEHLSAKMVYGIDNRKGNFNTYAPTTLYRLGAAENLTRKGAASLYTDEYDSKLLEIFGTYKNTFDKLNLTFTGGYSFNEINRFEYGLSLGDFPDDSRNWLNNIGIAYDLNEAGEIGAWSNTTEDDRVIAFFGRLSLNWDDAIFFSASLRQEGSSRFGEDQQWGLFPAVSAGVDINRYLKLDKVDLLKFRVGYGVTGALPGGIGYSQRQYGFTYDNTGGGTTNNPSQGANPDLSWETKAELNFGLEFNWDRLSTTLDVYTRDISDFIIADSETSDTNTEGANFFYRNAGDLKTSGFEMAVNYDIIQKNDFSYNSGIVFSSYNSELTTYTLAEGGTTGYNLGSPGHNSTSVILIKEGEEIGQIWGPVFSGEVDADGAQIMVDINGDGEIKVDQADALSDDGDFKVLGNGIPDFELGWSNQISYKNWDLNAFFRGAFGHSIVNTSRVFYEPRAAATSWNVVNTKYARDDIKVSTFSSLYVEKADFFKLDNLSLGYNFDLKENKYISGLKLTASGQNLFTITGYSGTDPEPATDNNVLTPGVESRSSYFSSRTFTLGLNINF